MTTYVVSSMNGVTYDFMTATILSVFFSVAIYVIGAVIPKPHVEQH